MNQAQDISQITPRLTKEERKVLECLQQQMSQRQTQPQGFVRRLLTQPLLLY